MARADRHASPEAGDVVPLGQAHAPEPVWPEELIRAAWRASLAAEATKGGGWHAVRRGSRRGEPAALHLSAEAPAS